MIVQPKSKLKADEYRKMAQTESDLAAACNLTMVREKHERAAAVWNELAFQQERAARSATVPAPGLAEALDGAEHSPA